MPHNIRAVLSTWRPQSLGQVMATTCISQMGSREVISMFSLGGACRGGGGGWFLSLPLARMVRYKVRGRAVGNIALRSEVEAGEPWGSCQHPASHIHLSVCPSIHQPASQPSTCEPERRSGPGTL